MTSIDLKTDFFKRSVLEVAPDLLGKVLVRKSDLNIIKTVITEVEAYDGEKDKACHASRGRSPRNEVMYGYSGFWYVYLVYGMHNMLNVVTGEVGYPAAVLIRGVDKINGPGRLTKFLSVDREFNKKEVSKETGLWIEEGPFRPSFDEIKRTKRIGVDYAKEWSDKPYRFLWNPKIN